MKGRGGEQMADTVKTEEYTAEDINVLEGLEAVRRRPAMYIGDTSSRGLHHLLYEVIDNSIDEAMVGYCTEISVTLHADGRATVKDNGRGIPVDIHEPTGKSALEVVLTMLHAGGKFEHKVYRISGGLHGVGVSVVNALSSSLTAIVRRDGFAYQQTYQKGKPITPVQKVGKTDERGTEITFLPDASIMEVTSFDYSTVQHRLKELSYLNRNLKIFLKDERTGTEECFHSEAGLMALVMELNEGEETLFTPPFSFTLEEEDLILEGALQYIQGTRERILTFANNIHTEEGGTHLEGFKASLTNCIKRYAEENDLIKEKEISLSGEDVREGLTAVISVKLPEPQFEGQTKTKLGTSRVKSQVQTLFGAEFYRFLEMNPQTARAIVNRCCMAARARIAARKAAELTRKSALTGGTMLPGKLVDCISKNPEESELFIVEGDSAGGNAKQGRDSKHQAILPLRGKILNVEKASDEKILNNEEIKALITAIGTGVTLGNHSEFDISRLRYGRIIIMTDADIDGAHIRTLLLTFFFKYMRQLIEEGRIYIALPPLYGIKKGKKLRYVFTDEEKDKILKAESDGVEVMRFKGLGEMDANELWETTMNPQTRTLRRVKLEDANAAAKMFNILMGKEVEPRKRFIIENAPTVQNLDI